MKLFPSSAYIQLEFDKIKALLVEECSGEYAKEKAKELQIHIIKEFIEAELKQSFEFKQLILTTAYFPDDYVLNLSRELKLLSVPGAVLAGDQFILLRRLTEGMEKIFRWFDKERKAAYKGLAKLIEGTHYERAVRKMIDDVLDEKAQVKDSASDELRSIRTNLNRKRNERRRLFERIISKLSRQGFLSEIEESFMNGRRVVAVFAEQKRLVKGILHGESDTRRTSFIEPGETIEMNNEIFSLEDDERKEIYRILRDLTKDVSKYEPLLSAWHTIIGEYDFIRGKARLAINMRGEYPVVMDNSHIHLVQAHHPLLFLYNQKLNKPTVPLTLTLDEEKSIIVISGPNAGGKTVCLKTAGLLQLMVQSGLLVPVHPSSQFGIFKQLMIHIGDTQSLEFELSTYSSHLLNMKYFIENANGRTLFFIDELGSGSDPNLGGAFAEVILEELAKKHAFGIVTTHYLNLKVMANKTAGIINGAMAFDEGNLLPLYKLIVGQPGSSYTFSIAERIGLDKELIKRAKILADQEHFQLDKLLNQTEQDLQNLLTKEKELHNLLRENEKLKKEMHEIMDKEKHRQHIEILKQQNRVTEERIDYLKDMERKLKQILIEWRKEHDKSKVIKNIEALFFNRNEQRVVHKLQSQIESKFEQVGGEIKKGDKVMMKQNHRVGKVMELRGKRAVVQVGLLPMQVELKDLIVVKEKEKDT